MKFPPWRRREEELEEEIQCHLRMAIRDRMQRGESAEEAESAARREFGNVGLIKETTRGMWGSGALETIWQDLHYGARMLLKQPGFTLVSVITLALGIGANTAIFSLVNSALLRPLAVAQPERLARIYLRGSQGTSFPNYRDLAAGNQTFSELAGHAVMQLNLGRGEAMTRHPRRFRLKSTLRWTCAYWASRWRSLRSLACCSGWRLHCSPPNLTSSRC